MSRVELDDVKAWVEDSKLNPQALDNDLLNQLEEEIFGRIQAVYDVSVWTDPSTTPLLIKVIIAKTYAGWLYDKFYSENQGVPNQYSQLVKANAEMLIMGILDGTIVVPGVTPVNDPGPAFYPNDASSAQKPTHDDPSLGPAKFSMGRMF